MLASLRGGNPYREQPIRTLQRLPSAIVIIFGSVEGSAVMDELLAMAFRLVYARPARKGHAEQPFVRSGLALRRCARKSL